MTQPASWPDRRLAGLRRFAIAISVLNVFGHLVLGFEQSWATPFIALAAAYGTELTIETIEAWANRRRPRFVGGGPRQLVDFLLSAHISGLAVGMLLYADGRLWVVAFAASLAIASKAILRIPVGPSPGPGLPRRTIHFLNPSNFAITVTLLTCHWVGGAPPYQFVENVSTAWHWLLPLIVFTTGSLLNTKFTGKMPLVAAWAVGFVIQAQVRSYVNATPPLAGLMPMTSLAFILYSFYMVTDPATTPSRLWCQVAFGAGVAAVYGLLVQLHIVFDLFYSLTIVSSVRGAWLAYSAWMDRHSVADVPVDVRSGRPAVVGGI